LKLPKLVRHGRLDELWELADDPVAGLFLPHPIGVQLLGDGRRVVFGGRNETAGLRIPAASLPPRRIELGDVPLERMLLGLGLGKTLLLPLQARR
jgi:hypothetical protein